MKKWLINLLGGYNKEQYDTAVKRAMKNSFVQELEYRVRGGNVIAVMVRHHQVFWESFYRKFDSNQIETVSKSQGYFVIDGVKYQAFTGNYPEKIRGYNLQGYILWD